jgi:hypothetical protein
MKFSAVLHLKRKDPQDVSQLCDNVITGLTDNATIYSEPNPTIADLTTENTTLINLLKLKDGSKLKNQIIVDQTDVVYALLKNELLYVNKVADGDRALILFSGFDSNNEPVSHGIPGKAVIKRVEDGSFRCSAKIYAEKVDEADRYKLEVTTTPSDSTSWKTALDPASLHHLEIKNLVRGQEIFIRFTGGNTHGWGIPSKYVSFIPR